jgi:hypothetical protein
LAALFAAFWQAQLSAVIPIPRRKGRNFIGSQNLETASRESLLKKRPDLQGLALRRIMM